MQKLKLATLLADKGLISADEFEDLLVFAQETGKRIGEVLVEAGYLSEEQVFRVLAEQHGGEYIDLGEVDVDRKLIAKYPLWTLKKNEALPVYEDDTTVTVVFNDPTDEMAQDAMQHAMQKKILKVATANPILIDKYLHQLEVDESIKEFLSEIKKEAGSTGGNEAALESGVFKLIQLIIENSIYARGSDIHIEPTATECVVRTRVDGVLVQSFVFDEDIYPPLSSRIKLLANLDIAEKRKPQDGRFSMSVNNKEFDFRISTLPTVHGESIVMRILDKSKVLIRLEDLGMYKNSFRKFSQSLKSPFGIVLVTGPTGSGKTTTLYAALNAIKGVHSKIVTVEDPVEYKIKLVQQVHVNEKAGLTFVAALRSILRQDPDVIMVGEIRDKETLRIAIQSALTGHLVLSTLHTNDAISAVPRMIDMGIEPFLVSSSLVAVEAQRLIRKLCPHCKKEHIPSAQLLKGAESVSPQNCQFFEPRGCDKCSNTGYLGREMISEVLTVSEEMGHMIAKEAKKHEILEQAKKEGFESMYFDGVRRAAAGITSLEEVVRVAKL